MTGIDQIIASKFSGPSRIIVAPLSWGIGHATRCLPLIRALQSQGHTVAVASDGQALEYLRREEPDLTYFELPGYNIHYRYPSMILNMLVQAPKIYTVIGKEHKCLKGIYLTWQPDTIISDNRFGFYHQSCRNIFLTHQLLIAHKVKLASVLATRWNSFMTRKFDEFWIPDFKSGHTLAGKLSHHEGFRNRTYLGPLSRFEQRNEDRRWDLICVLSGPEPQRSILESKLVKVLEKVNDRKILLVRGIISKKLQLKGEHIVVKDFLDAASLNVEVEAAAIVLSRSGYSSIMDWTKLKKKSIIIPTPGQPEQEYLAEFHRKNPRFIVLLQKELINLPQYL